MFQNFRKYFPAGVLLLMTPLLLWCAPIPAPVSKYYPVRFENANVSSRARTIVLINMLRNDILHSLPAQNKGAVPYKLTIHYKEGDPARIFSIERVRHQVCRINLPERFEDLLMLPNALSTLTAWFLAASAGHDPMQADPIINSWYVTGIARRLLRNVVPLKSPFLQYFPSAYVLASHGKYPSLESLLSQELTREDSCARLLYEEYSELLVLICSRQRLFQKGLLCALLEKTFQDPARKDMASHFQNFVFTHADKKEKALFKTEPGTVTDSGKVLDQWFRREAEKLLNWIFLPASARKIEEIYLQATRFETPAAKEPDQQSGQKLSLNRKGAGQTAPQPVKMIRGTLAELPGLSESIANPAHPAIQMASAVSRAARIASPDLLDALLKVRSALLAFAAKQSQKTGGELLKANRGFYQALERNVLLERFLAETEKKVLPPGTRYYATMILLNQDRKQELPTLRNLEAFLRETQGKVHSP